VGRTGSGGKWTVLKSAVDAGKVHNAAMRASALRDLVNWHRSPVPYVSAFPLCLQTLQPVLPKP